MQIICTSLPTDNHNSTSPTDRFFAGQMLFLIVIIIIIQLKEHQNVERLPDNSVKAQTNGLN